MSCCCENSFDLGCANPCWGLQLPALSVDTGLYTLEANGVQITEIEQAQTAGSRLEFDTSNLLQSYRYSLRVFKSGQLVTFEDGAGGVYDCFTLQTTIGGQPYVGAVSLLASI